MKTTETISHVFLNKQRFDNSSEMQTRNPFLGSGITSTSITRHAASTDSFVMEVEEIEFAAPVEVEIVETATDQKVSIVSKSRLDLSYLQSFANGDKEFENEMLLSALEDMDEAMGKLRTAIHAGNHQETRSRAHSLKSLSSIIGTHGLFSAFGILESSVDFKPAAREIGQQLRGIEKDWTLVRHELIGLMASNA